MMAEEERLKERLKEDYILYLFSVRGLAPITIGNYLEYFPHLNHIFNPSQQDIDDLILKKKNVNVCRSFLKSYLEYRGIENLKIPPTSKGRKAKKEIRIYSDEDVQKVTEALYDFKFSYGIVFELLIHGALRREEIVNLKINSFYWKDWLEDVYKMCKVKVDGKGKKVRTILIPPELTAKIYTFFSDRYNPQLLKTVLKSDKPLFMFNKHKIWKICKKGGLRGIGKAIRPHELRHRKATEMEKAGVDIRDIQLFLGHSSVQVTELYLHTDVRLSLSKIESILNPKV